MSFAAPARRRCLYEILEIARSADNDQIKAAYKTQARVWHPDKNIDNQEEATHRFKEINEAFEILSDRHERAWYDAHREAILRGIDKRDIGRMNADADDDSIDPDIDLMPYFSPFCWSSFDDGDDDSFYGIYDTVFQDIIALEKLSKKRTPSFGDSSLAYPKMKSFYEFWEAFESRRSFTHATKYNLNDAENRRIRKLMHKENRKLVEARRKQWEQTVWKLVAFVKKRDPRWRSYLIELERQKLEEEQQLQQYQREIEEIMKEEQRKQRERALEQHAQEEDVDVDVGDAEVPDEKEAFECVACNKVFRSERAFDTHELSKKHIRGVENLRVQLLLEEQVVFGGATDDRKIDDQCHVDAMIAKQMATQQNVENAIDNDDREDSGSQSQSQSVENGNENENDATDDENDDENDDSNDEAVAEVADTAGDIDAEAIATDEAHDLDYLVALSVEHEAMVDAIDAMNVLEIDAMTTSADANKEQEQQTGTQLTDDEILTLLGNGIDIDSLMVAYPSLSKSFVMDLVAKHKLEKKNNNKYAAAAKKNKRRKKRRGPMDEVFAHDSDRDEAPPAHGDDEETMSNEKEDKPAQTPAEEETQHQQEPAEETSKQSHAAAHSHDNDDVGDDDDDDDEEDHLDEFMKQFTTFNNTKQKQKQKQNMMPTTNVSHNEQETSKKKRRRRRKDNKDAKQVHKQNARVSASIPTSMSPVKSKCNACEQTFGSKTKLYAHLKENPQHAIKTNH